MSRSYFDGSSLVPSLRDSGKQFALLALLSQVKIQRKLSEGWETSWATQGTSRVRAALSHGRQQGTLGLLRPHETCSEN